MGQITLTIAEIRSPAEGKERGSIIGTDGTRLGCFREKLGTFQIGQTYAIEHTDGDYRNVKGAKVTAALAPQPQQPTQRSNGNGYSVGNGNGHSKDEQIWTQGLLQSLIKAGHVGNDKRQLWEAAVMLRNLWHASFGRPPSASGINTFTPSEAGHRHVAGK
jgi:hypothetical protein